MYVRLNKRLNNDKGVLIGTEIIRSDKEYTEAITMAQELGYYIDEEWISYLEYLKTKKSTRRGNGRVQNTNK